MPSLLGEETGSTACSVESTSSFLGRHIRQKGSLTPF